MTTKNFITKENIKTGFKNLIHIIKFLNNCYSVLKIIIHFFK